MKVKILYEQSLSAVTVTMEMRSVFLAVFGEILIGHMTNVVDCEWIQAPEVGDV